MNYASPVPRPSRELSVIDLLYKILGAGAGGRRAATAKLPLPGRFCRAIYVSLTTKGRSSRSHRETKCDAHLRTERHHSRVIRRQCQANLVDRFFAAGSTTTTETRSAAPPKAAGNIDALLALQGVEDPTERRKRSVQRGRGALDVLDDLKIGLLSGNFDASTVSRLRDAAANLKSSSGDPGLDAVLSEIELRVEVELAKAGQF